MRDYLKFYIDGKWVDPVTPKTLDVINPATEKSAGRISLGSAADVDLAVKAARKAFDSFSRTSRQERMELLAAIIAEYQKRFGDVAMAITEEMGAPANLANKAQAPIGLGHLSTALEVLKTFEFEHDRGPTRIAKEPIGVCAFITPWNWPMNQIALKAIPAILSGCTCVLKPSEESPLNAMIFAEFCHDAGLPPGVFNLVNGDGMGVGSQLSTHPDVEMISFTGSTRAGRAITKAAAETLKRVTLELGGKGANVIFADADDAAVERGVRHMMDNSGQSCNAPSRMLVQRPVYDRAVTIAAQVADSIKVGSAHEAGDHIGPVVNKRQWDQIQGYIQKGIDEGARLVAGGPGLPEGFNRGFYVKPTVFADVTPGMTIEREEIFGPVLSMIPFETEADAVRIANDSPYGLTHYVQTQDGAKRNRMALALKAGMVQTNGRSRGAGAFFGGVKSSGRAREGGIWGLEEFLESKAISGWDLSQPLAAE
jgi:aldehyde dehydrogenase (NAD+)